jgi:hypothetical protein
MATSFNKYVKVKCSKHCLVASVDWNKKPPLAQAGLRLVVMPSGLRLKVGHSGLAIESGVLHQLREGVLDGNLPVIYHI